MSEKKEKLQESPSAIFLPIKASFTRVIKNKNEVAEVEKQFEKDIKEGKRIRV